MIALLIPYFYMKKKGPLKKLWLEININPLVFKQDFADVYLWVRFQDAKKRHGLPTLSIKESEHFYALILYVNSIIPWGNSELYELNAENRRNGYYWSIVYYLLTGSTIANGQRNLFGVPLKLFTSNTLIFAEYEDYHRQQFLEILRSGKLNEKLSILEFLKKYDKDSNIEPNFFMRDDRSDQNDCCPGIHRTSPVLSTYKKKVGKGKNQKKTITQPCMLVCGCTLNDHKKGSKSAMKCAYRMPFPCSFCAMLQVGNYIWDVTKKYFSSDISGFNDYLKKKQDCDESEHVSYLLHMDKNGEFCGKKVYVNKSNLMKLPNFTNGNLTLCDPGRWALQFCFNASLTINGKRTPIMHLIDENQILREGLFKKMFPSLDSWYFVNEMKEKFKQNKKEIVGCYSTRSLATYMCQLANVRPVIMDATFGWSNSSGRTTLEKSYSFHGDIRDFVGWQIELEEILYKHLLCRLEKRICTRVQNTKESEKMEILLAGTHPLNSPSILDV